MDSQSSNATILHSGFLNSISAVPQFKGRTHEIRTVGNEVVLSLVTEDDVRAPMQMAVANMIDHLNGRVYARGPDRVVCLDVRP